MKLPIRRIPNTSPPQFEYFVAVNLPGGGVQNVRQQGKVPSSMEAALCKLLDIAEQQAKELAKRAN